MIKTLQTCFLALLCLAGSPPALSQVVQSPGAGLLHRFAGPTVSPHSGDTHRGGDTRPDTFPCAELSRSISTPHEIDGGPMAIRPRNSTSAAESTSGDVFQLQPIHGCGQLTVVCGPNNETATSAQKPPRSDVSGLRSLDNRTTRQPDNLTPVLSPDEATPPYLNCKQQTAVDCGLLTVDCNPPGFSLVDNATSQGQEVSPSARVGEEAKGGIPAVIYVETLSDVPIDSLEFRIWDPYLNELDVPKPFIEKVALSTGTLFDGSRGAKVVQWQSPALTGYGRVTLRNGKHTFLDRFLVEPGDSVRIVFDLQTAKVLFSGPAAEKFKCQYELTKALENEQYDRNPIMFTWTSNFWGYSLEDSLKIKQIKEKQSSIRRSMEYLASDDNGINYLEREFARKPETHPAFEVLSRYRGKLQQEFLQVLEADILGKLYNGQLTAFSSLYKGSKKKETYQQFYRDHIAGTMPEMPNGSDHSAFYPEFLYQRLVIQSVIEREPLRNLLVMVPQPVRDRVDAIYILKNYRKFKDSNLQFELALGRIETPWISELIGSVYTAQRIGEPLAAIPLTTVSGDSLILAEDSGKIRFLHFWLPGCEASSNAYKRLVAPVEAHFQNDEQVEFVYVSHDDNPTRWLSNIQSGDFATAGSLNLNAPGSPHPFLKYYNIHNYPTYMVLGKDGTVVSVGNIPKTPETLIQFLDSLKQEIHSTPKPQSK